MKDDLFERLERAIGGLVIHGIDSSAITEAVTEIVTLTKQLEKTCGALVLQEKMRREMEQAEIDDFDKIRELTKQRDALIDICRKLKKHAAPHISAWEFESFWMDVDGEKFFKEMADAIALCPEVKERKDDNASST